LLNDVEKNTHTLSTTSINNRETDGMKKKNEYEDNKARAKKKKHDQQIILLSK